MELNSILAEEIEVCMFIERQLKTVIEAGSKFFPAILLTGPRQVGKTTFLRRMAEPERRYVTLDDVSVRTLAHEDPKGFIEKFAPPVLIDEIQYVPELLNYIKIVIDEQRFNDPEKARGMYWLTGSQRFPLMKGVSESLAGRIGIFEMSGLSQAELADRKNTPFTPDLQFSSEKGSSASELFKRIWTGCYPEVINATGQERDFFYSSYIATYLERDIRNLTKVHDLDKFYKFLCSCAARTGQLLNNAELARDAGIDNKTAQSWLTILTSSRIVYLHQPYTGSLTARLVKTPKLYMLDTGLCAYLTRWPTPETLEAGAMSGEFFETWCISEILKSYWNAGINEPSLYFYRDKDKKEIALLIESADGFYPVEFKKSSTPKGEDAKHFNVLEKLKIKVKKGAVVCCCPEIMPLPNKDVLCIPASLI